MDMEDIDITCLHAQMRSSGANIERRQLTATVNAVTPAVAVAVDGPGRTMETIVDQ